MTAPATLPELRLAFIGAYLLGAKDEAEIRGSGASLITEHDAEEAWQQQLAIARDLPEPEAPPSH